MTATHQPCPTGFDPTDPDLCQAADPAGTVPRAAQDRTGVVGRADAGGARGLPRTTGYWAVSRHEDVAAVSKNSKDFSTAENGAIIRFGPDMDARPGRAAADHADQPGPARAHQDPPDHQPRLHARARSARCTTSWSSGPRRSSTTPWPRASGDFVEEVAAELPLQAIADLLGVPQEDRRKLFDWSNQMLAQRRPGVRRRSRTSPPPRSWATRWGWPRTARPEPARRHHHQADQRRRRRAAR